MSDLISRSALIAEYDRIHKGEPGEARKLMENAPAVDAVPVRYGRWENGKCTGCGFEPSWLLEDGESFLAQWVWDEGLDFCPGCGARMDGEDEK